MSTKLILLRHGESQWNLENRFTGWTDVDLTVNGKNEAKKAGELLFKENLNIKAVYVSYLKRAIKTSKICLKQLNLTQDKVIYDWRLNERHYGNLQGLNKLEVAKKYGEEQVLLWRRSYDIQPPQLSIDDKRHPKHDILYRDIEENLLPCSESLKDMVKRVMPLWIEQIVVQLKNRNNVLIVAHGNSLRAIVKILKGLSNEEVLSLNIPTAAPYIFELNENLELKSDEYLGNEDEIAKKSELVANQSARKIN
tara:strand:- start:2835 stop:3590 length:756 start_codon:yes stop_codon:yes gene_type:complete